jgi:hypothetical protein
MCVYGHPTLTFFIGNYSTLIFANNPINFYTEFGIGLRILPYQKFAELRPRIRRTFQQYIQILYKTKNNKEKDNKI